MSLAHKQRLAERLIANQQRRQARLFVERLAPPLRNVLSESRVIFAPESERIAQHHFASERGVGIEQPVRPRDFFFAALRSSEDVFMALKSFGDKVDAERGYFRPAHFSHNTPPIFEVNFGWARRHLNDLYLPSGRAFGLTIADGQAGIYTHVVCGYQDRDADEEVFELGYWGN